MPQRTQGAATPDPIADCSDRPTIARRFPVGAEVPAGCGVHFRVCTSSRKRVEVMVQSVHSPQQGSPWTFGDRRSRYIPVARPGMAGEKAQRPGHLWSHFHVVISEQMPNH